MFLIFVLNIIVFVFFIYDCVNGFSVEEISNFNLLQLLQEMIKSNLVLPVLENHQNQENHYEEYDELVYLLFFIDIT